MSELMLFELWKALGQTVTMTLVSGLLATLFGLPLGVLLLTTKSKGLLAHPLLNRVLNIIVNITRSIPFIILLIAIVPFTRLLVGTSIGTSAAIVPLTVGAIPFVARLIQNALEEVPSGLIEVGLAMGANPLQIINRILIPEALPGIVNALTVTLITLVGYSAMAGAVGGGGLGDLAIRYGYHRFDINIMLITVAILIVMVQLIQFAGDFLVRRVNHR